MSKYRFIEFTDFNSEKRNVVIQPKKYVVNEWTVLYVALKFDPVLNCYKYLGSALSEKGVESIVLLLSEYPDTTAYAEIPESLNYLQKLKQHFDQALKTQPTLCFQEAIKKNFQ